MSEKMKSPSEALEHFRQILASKGIIMFSEKNLDNHATKVFDSSMGVIIFSYQKEPYYNYKGDLEVSSPTWSMSRRIYDKTPFLWLVIYSPIKGIFITKKTNVMESIQNGYFRYNNSSKHETINIPTELFEKLETYNWSK